MAATNICDSIEKIVSERLAPGVRDGMVELDPTFSEVIEDYVSASRQDVIGRDWKVIHTFVVSLAGSIKPIGTIEGSGDNMAYPTTTTDGPHSQMYSPSATFPTVADCVAPGYIQKTISLQRWRGAMAVPHDLLRADRLTAAIASAVGHTIRQTARNVAAQKANMFFASGTTRSLGSVSSVSAGGTTGDTVATLVITGRIRKFHPGMLVEVRDYSNSYALLNNATYTKVLVKKVDPLNSTIILENTHASGTWAANIAANDILVLRGAWDSGNTKSYGPTGLEDWVKATADVSVFGINLQDYPQFASYVADMSSATLTDQILRKYVGGFMEAYSADQWPDTLLTTAGVLADYIGETDSLRRFMVQGTSTDVRGGFKSGPAFDYDGRKIAFRTGPLVPSGYLYGIKLRGNIKRYAPPRLPNASTGDLGDGSVEFVAPLGGLKGIWMHATSSDALTPYVLAPFEICEEYCPESMPGIKLTSLSEFTVS